MKEEAVKTRHSRFYRIIAELCPRCGQTKVFRKQRHLLAMPEMNRSCSHCGYHFDREPGYFLGAMYISYGLSVLWGGITFLICYFLFPGLPTIWIPILILVAITLMAIKSWKLSRIIYMHIFPW
jgi:uncharacterized protein (DUF983 family)